MQQHASQLPSSLSPIYLGTQLAKDCRAPQALNTAPGVMPSAPRSPSSFELEAAGPLAPAYRRIDLGTIRKPRHAEEVAAILGMPQAVNEAAARTLSLIVVAGVIIGILAQLSPANAAQSGTAVATTAILPGSTMTFIGWALAFLFGLLWLNTRIELGGAVERARLERLAANAFALKISGNDAQLFLRLWTNEQPHIEAEFPKWPAFRDRFIQENAWGTE